MQPVRFEYGQRLQIIEKLIERRGGEAEEMYGIRAMTQWQIDSGRDRFRWWSTVNFTLTVWQAQVMHLDGEPLRKGRTLVRSADPCLTNVPDHVARGILSYWRAVDAGASVVGRQRLLWDWHVDAVRWATRRLAAGHFQALPSGEQRFARAWGRTVELLAAANFPTDRAAIEATRLLLPPRIVQDADYRFTMTSDLGDSGTAIRAMELLSRRLMGRHSAFDALRALFGAVGPLRPALKAMRAVCLALLRTGIRIDQATRWLWGLVRAVPQRRRESRMLLSRSLDHG